MPDWEMCSTPENRTCWLRERVAGKLTGRQFDISTNYEDEKPMGVERKYDIVLEDSSWDADGLNFPEAKLFRRQDRAYNEYPGPWIQACWGDTYATLSLPKWQ
jgi:hypothetical protein